ncbi:unnamed protein product [Effrenium voratum]|nr:unnamed protein product [Effrenium voratum]
MSTFERSMAGATTPPRRSGRTPDFCGPEFSASPALPGSRRGEATQRTYLEDSAVTVQIRGSHGQVAVGDSAATLAAKKPVSSLDAWLGPDSQLRRARSLPTAAFEGSPAPHPCRSLAPHLVLDFGPSGSSEDDRVTRLRPAKEAILCLACGSQLATDANFCPKCGRSRESHELREIREERPKRPERRVHLNRRAMSSGSSGDQVRRGASLSRRQILPSDSEEVTLEPEAVKVSSRKKTSSRPRRAMISEARSGDDKSQEAKTDEALDQAKALAAKQAEADEAAAEARASAEARVAAEAEAAAAAAEAIASAEARAEAEARASSATAEAEAALQARRAAEAKAQAAAESLSAAEQRIAAAAQTAAEAKSAADAWAAEAKANADAKAAAHVRLTALRNEAASASDRVAGLGELNERLRWGLLAAGLRQKELCLATRLLRVAVGDFRRAQDTQRRWRQVAFQVQKRQVQRVGQVARAVAEELQCHSAAGEKCQALAAQLRRRAVRRLAAAVAAAGRRRRCGRQMVLALQACARRYKADALSCLRRACHAGWRCDLFGRALRARQMEQRLRRALKGWRLVQARPRRLAAALRAPMGRCGRWALQRLARHGLELRWEQRLGRAVAAKAQSIQHESQQRLEAVRGQMEERVYGLSGQKEELLHRLATSMAREVKLISSLADRQLLGCAWAQWQLWRRRRAAARRLGRLLLRHLRRRHLQIWRRQTEVDALSYLEVQIDCFDSFTSKRNALCWRVLRRCGGLWTSELQDLTLVAALGAWRLGAEAAERRRQRRALACHRLQAAGLQLLRRRMWAPWLSWQQAEVRSLSTVMRQVEEAHAREEVEQLKEELDKTRRQAASQHDTLAAEFSQLRSGQLALEQSSRVAAAAWLRRGWASLARQLRGAALRAMLRPLAAVRAWQLRSEALCSSWRFLCSALLRAQPWHFRSSIALQAAEKMRLRALQVEQAEIERAKEVSRSAAMDGLMKSLVSSLHRALRDRLLCWQRACLWGGRQAAEGRGCALAELCVKWTAARQLKKCLGAWHGRATGPRRLAAALAVPMSQGLSWAFRKLQCVAVRKRQAALRSACWGAAARRQRLRRLVDFFRAWRGDALGARLRQRRTRHLECRKRLRLCRSAFRSWIELGAYFRKLHRMMALLRRSWRFGGLVRWRLQDARRSAKTGAEQRGHEELRRALAQQKVSCEYFVEAQSRECAARTAKAEMQRERAYHEQVQALQQRALAANHEAQEEEHRLQLRVAKMEEEMQEANQKSEKAMEQMLQEKQRAVELQTCIAEDQEKNIRNLEDLLKEQGELLAHERKDHERLQLRFTEAEDQEKVIRSLEERLKEQGEQLARERKDHLRSLDALRASSAMSESKYCLLQEQAEMQRERAYHEQVQALQQRASAANHEAQEEEHRLQLRVAKMEEEMQETHQKSEKAMEQMLQEKQRAVELQTSIAEDQEKNIRNLEDLLKEQEQQLTRERKEHLRGVDSLRASAAMSESKSCLLQEQVVALRQQLQREQQELMASERAWSSDRAALLCAVTNSSLPPSRARTRSSSRRKASPAPASPAPGPGGSPGGARCPWHGPGAARKLAPALM